MHRNIGTVSGNAQEYWSNWYQEIIVFDNSMELIDPFPFYVSLAILYSYLWHPFSFVTFPQLSCFFFCNIYWYCIAWLLTFWKQKKKFFIELMIRLPCNMIHQSVEYFWVTKTKVMHQFFSLMNLFFFL